MIYALFMILAIVLALLVRPPIGAPSLGQADPAAARNAQRRRRIYCALLGICLFLISALRASTVGSDTRTYLGHFQRIHLMNWETILYLYQEEPGFYIVAKLLSLWTYDGQWMLALYSLLYAFSVSWYIYRNSADCLISFSMLIPFMFFAFSMTGLRQTAAISIVLLSFEFVRTRKALPYFLLMLLAIAFHRSAILALPIYYLYSIRMTPFKRLVLLLLIPAIYLFRYNIITLLQRWFYSDYQIDRSTNNTWATFAVYFLIWAAKLYLLAIAGRAAPHVAQCGPGRQVEAIFIIGFIIQLFVPFEPNIFRIGLYYQSSVLLLVPQITSESRLSLRSRR